MGKLGNLTSVTWCKTCPWAAHDDESCLKNIILSSLKTFFNLKRRHIPVSVVIIIIFKSF